MASPSAKNRLILALDVPDADAALSWVRRLGARVGLVKIGLELFVAAGPELVRRVRDEGLGVFLDLKLHDIPNTVTGAVRSAAALDVQMLTIHASGGPKMMAAAVAAAAESPRRPLIFGVTVLTSLDAGELARLEMPGTPAERVLAWSQLCQRAGCDGVVASALEGETVKIASQGKLKLIVPGVRPAGAGKGDQARVATPAQALSAGADYIVIGRAVTAAEDPEAALAAVTAEAEAALAQRVV